MRRDASTQAGYDPAVVEAVLDALPRRHALVGVSGVQGSGKSTLAAQLASAARSRGVDALVLALDDFYLGRRDRLRLARNVHPLLATRGVPGTHDIALLTRTLRALRHADATHPVRIPRFDKGRDTRLAPSRWRRVTRAPRLILLEGWCIGVPPQSAKELARAVNALERTEDSDARWRRWVNRQLATSYAELWRWLDGLIVLAAPGFDVVERWRGEQERAMRRRGAPHALSSAALSRFVMHYERISRHALRTLPDLADVLIVLDAMRHVRRIRFA